MNGAPENVDRLSLGSPGLEEFFRTGLDGIRQSLSTEHPRVSQENIPHKDPVLLVRNVRFSHVAGSALKSPRVTRKEWMIYAVPSLVVGQKVGRKAGKRADLDERASRWQIANRVVKAEEVSLIQHPGIGEGKPCHIFVRQVDEMCPSARSGDRASR